MTSKRDRFLAAARGESPDRPPVGAWVHYGSARWSPEQVAEAHLRFYRDYDWDFIKVMHDYRIDLPEGLEEITDPAQLDDILADPGVSLDSHARQHEVLELIRTAAPEAAIIETLFSPTQTLVRALGRIVIDYFKADPALAHRTIARVAGVLACYATGLADLGVDALFVAVNGASKDPTSFGLTPEQFRDWVAPYDIQVLAAATPLVRIAHLHGEDAQPELIADYPVEVLSWSDRDSEPAIADATSRYGWAPMVGIDEIDSLYWTPSEAAAHVLRARRAAGDRLIVAPNCTLHSDINPHALEGLRRGVEAALED